MKKFIIVLCCVLFSSLGFANVCTCGGELTENTTSIGSSYVCSECGKVYGSSEGGSSSGSGDGSGGDSTVVGGDGSSGNGSTGEDSEESETDSDSESEYFKSESVVSPVRDSLVSSITSTTSIFIILCFIFSIISLILKFRGKTSRKSNSARFSKSGEKDFLVTKTGRKIYYTKKR